MPQKMFSSWLTIYNISNIFTLFPFYRLLDQMRIFMDSRTRAWPYFSYLRGDITIERCQTLVFSACTLLIHFKILMVYSVSTQPQYLSTYNKRDTTLATEKTVDATCERPQSSPQARDDEPR